MRNMDTVVCEQDLHLLCRVCLNDSLNYCNIYEEYLRDKHVYEVLNDVCQLDVMFADGLPIYVCCDCREWIADFESFKRNSHVGNSVLRRLKEGLIKVEVKEETDFCLENDPLAEGITFRVKKEEDIKVEEEYSEKYEISDDEEIIEIPVEEDEMRFEDEILDYAEDDGIDIEEHSPHIKVEAEDAEGMDVVSEERSYGVGDFNARMEHQSDLYSKENTTNKGGWPSEDEKIDVVELPPAIPTENAVCDFSDSSFEDSDSYSIISEDFQFPAKLSDSMLGRSSSNTLVSIRKDAESEKSCAMDSGAQVTVGQRVEGEGSCGFGLESQVPTMQAVVRELSTDSIDQVSNMKDIERKKSVAFDSGGQVSNREAIKQPYAFDSRGQVPNKQAVENAQSFPVDPRALISLGQDLEREQCSASESRTRVSSWEVRGYERLGELGSNVHVSNGQLEENERPLLNTEGIPIHWNWTRRIVKVNLPGVKVSSNGDVGKRAMDHGTGNADVVREHKNAESGVLLGSDRNSSLEPVKDAVPQESEEQCGRCEPLKSPESRFEDVSRDFQAKSGPASHKNVPFRRSNDGVSESRRVLRSSHKSLDKLTDSKSEDLGHDLQAKLVPSSQKNVPFGRSNAGVSESRRVLRSAHKSLNKLTDSKSEDLGHDFQAKLGPASQKNVPFGRSNDGVSESRSLLRCSPKSLDKSPDSKSVDVKAQPGAFILNNVAVGGCNVRLSENRGVPESLTDSHTNMDRYDELKRDGKKPELAENIHTEQSANKVPKVLQFVIHKLRNFVCNECGKDFPSELELVLHERTHAYKSKPEKVNQHVRDYIYSIPVMKLDSVSKAGSNPGSSYPATKLDGLAGSRGGIPVVKLDGLSKVGNGIGTGIPYIKLGNLLNVGDATGSGFAFVKLDGVSKAVGSNTGRSIPVLSLGGSSKAGSSTASGVPFVKPDRIPREGDEPLSSLSVPNQDGGSRHSFSKVRSNTTSGIPLINLDGAPREGDEPLSCLSVPNQDGRSGFSKVRTNTASGIPLINLDGAPREGDEPLSRLSVPNQDSGSGHSFSKVRTNTASGIPLINLDGAPREGDEPLSSLSVPNQDSGSGHSFSKVRNNIASGIPVVKPDGIPREGDETASSLAAPNPDGAPKPGEYLECDRLLACRVCNAFIHDKGQLDYHRRLHRKENGFKCRYCSKRFKRKYNLVGHEQSHVLDVNNPTVFVCPVCGKLFTKFHYISRHLKTHTGAKCHQCSVCDKVFGSEVDLKVHKLAHLDKPYWCRVCYAQFDDEKALLEHEGAVVCKKLDRTGTVFKDSVAGDRRQNIPELIVTSIKSLHNVLP